MKLFMLGAITLLCAGLIGGQAFGARFGTVILKAGERQSIDIGATGRNMRVCNDYFSSGPILVTIGDNLPHDLSPGVCAEDIGDRLMIQSRASGIATVDFKAICDGAEMSR